MIKARVMLAGSRLLAGRTEQQGSAVGVRWSWPGTTGSGACTSSDNLTAGYGLVAGPTSRS